VDRALTLWSPLWMPTLLNQEYMGGPQRNIWPHLHTTDAGPWFESLKINDWVRVIFPVILTTPMHFHKSGDAVRVKEWNIKPLKPHWRDPVILSTFIAVKVADIALWICHSWVKPASLDWEYIPDPALLCKVTIWNICALPKKDPSSQETLENHRQKDDSPALVTPEAH
jgi:hypothetical protein